MLLKIKYSDENGASRILFIDAVDEQSIRSHPAFISSVLSISPLPELLKGVFLKRLSLDSQLLLLSQISALVQSGGDIAGIRDVVEAMPDLGGITKDPRYRHASTITDFLAMCGVDSISIRLVMAGEGSGRIAESMEDAVTDIEKRMELLAATKGDVTKGLFYVAAGMSMLVGLSLMLNKIILQLMAADRMAVNFGTDILLMINSAFTDYLLVTVGVAAGVFLGARKAWGKSRLFRNIPAVRTYNNYRKVVRSLAFISTWRPLYLSGVQMMDALTQVKMGLSGLDGEAVDIMIENVREGKSIANSLSKDYWSTAFRIGMKPFDSANDESKKKLLFRIQVLLQTEVQTLGKRLGSMMLTVGMLAAVMTVLLMAFGFYMPMLGGMKMF